jgi:hypothetical protein
MIHLLLTKLNSFTFKNYLKTRGKGLSDSINLIYYNDLSSLKNITTGTFIFSDLDLLNNNQLQITKHIYNQLAQKQPNIRILNNPNKVLCRYKLLQTMYNTGINRFRVLPAIGSRNAWESLRYPVFIKEENQHTGSLSNLINSAKELEKVIIEKVLFGYSRRSLLIVEYCNTSDKNGIYRKYSAFNVGGNIIPRFMDISDQWVVKASNTDEKHIKEADYYATQNPHYKWLKKVFAIANIDYGRIDYSLLGEDPQLWEINLNPIIVPGSSNNGDLIPLMRLRIKVLEGFYREFYTKFGELNSSADEYLPIKIKLSQKQLRSMKPIFRTEIINLLHRKIWLENASTMHKHFRNILERSVNYLSIIWVNLKQIFRNSTD